MDIGRLNCRISIQARSSTQDAAGQEVETWTTFVTVWASRRDVRGRERFTGEQRYAARSGVYQIRFMAGVHEEMRIVDNGITYRIIGIADNARQGWLELTVESVNPGGVVP